MFQTKDFTRVVAMPFYRRSKIFRVFSSFLTVALYSLFVCEYAIYPIVLRQCEWPEIDSNDLNELKNLKAFVLSDTHLLGPFRGHWLDKLKREWQMYRSFQTAVSMFKPEVVFFLGDLFDEGQWVNNKGFEKYVNRFHELFYVNTDLTKIYTVSGNHDIGFHNMMTPRRNNRMNRAFNSTSVEFLTLKSTNFVLINSVAMQGDDCSICSEAREKLVKVNETLNCLKAPETCKNFKNPPVPYIPPVLLQHYPLYRKSDSECFGPDATPELLKYLEFRPKLDCISKESSHTLLSLLNPALILSGHTHYSCEAYHDLQDGRTVLEYSVPSFSSRNLKNPSFLLAIFNESKSSISKCFLPQESTQYLIYIFGFLIAVQGAISRRSYDLITYLPRKIFSLLFLFVVKLMKLPFLLYTWFYSLL